MATETLLPDGLLEQSNLSGALTDIDEGVAAADAVYLTANDDGTNTSCRVSFPTPTGNPTVGAGLQAFSLRVRKSTVAGGNNPSLDIELWESGVLNTVLSTGTTISNTSGQTVTATWDATLLNTADGSNVELRGLGQRSGGSPANRRTVEFDAVEWVVDYVEAGGGWGNTIDGETNPGAIDGVLVANIASVNGV